MIPTLIITDDSAELSAAFQKFGGDVMPATNAGIMKLALRIVKRMRQPGSPISYPVRWDSDKQRRAFFATGGFGGGIPTQRTDAIPDAWEANRLAGGVVIDNNQPGALFVNGDEFGQSQSLIHQGRWPLFSKVADEELQQLDADVENAIKGVASIDGVQME